MGLAKVVDFSLQGVDLYLQGVVFHRKGVDFFFQCVDFYFQGVGPLRLPVCIRAAAADGRLSLQRGGGNQRRTLNGLPGGGIVIINMICDETRIMISVLVQVWRMDAGRAVPDQSRD